MITKTRKKPRLRSSSLNSENNQASCYIVHPVLPSGKSSKSVTRGLDSILEEIRGLAYAIDLEILDLRVAKVTKIQAGAFLGKGQREVIGEDVKTLKPDVVIVNYTLSPVQQRNLEKEWQVKVIDRTGLILEIFSARAQTKEGTLQVRMAALEYQRSRLVRSWTHLERQRGGAGFLGGPGEKQMELDRRMLEEKIIRLKKELEEVRRTRDLARKSRERVPFPVVALVGYTNAGKSTLFNKIAGADVFAKDLLFATLDPTMRRLKLPNGQQAILSDTVGFISDLPTHLVAAFRATLEQIAYADVIVHVIDSSRPDFEAQKQDVIDILKDLGIDYETDERIVEAYNKIDALDQDSLEEFQRQTRFIPNMVLVSALTGDGLKDFSNFVTRIVSAHHKHVKFQMPSTDGKALSWLYEHSQIIARKDTGEKISVSVMIDPADLGKFTDRYGYKADFADKKKRK